MDNINEINLEMYESDLQFNSLLENEIKNDNMYYKTSNTDNFYGIQEYEPRFEKQELEDNAKLYSRNFFDKQNLILSGRPCNTSLCNPEQKFCDSSGRPYLVTKNNVDNLSNRISDNIDASMDMIKQQYSQKCPPKLKTNNERNIRINPNCKSNINPNFFASSKRIYSEKW